MVFCLGAISTLTQGTLDHPRGWIWTKYVPSSIWWWTYIAQWHQWTIHLSLSRYVFSIILMWQVFKVLCSLCTILYVERILYINAKVTRTHTHTHTHAHTRTDVCFQHDWLWNHFLFSSTIVYIKKGLMHVPLLDVPFRNTHILWYWNRSYVQSRCLQRSQFQTLNN